MNRFASEYSEKLKDPRWQKRRLEILERDEWMCVLCANKERTLHVHHCWYEDNVDPWDYPPHCLVTLCEDCHAKEPKGFNLTKIQRLLMGVEKVAIDIALLARLVESYDDRLTPKEKQLTQTILRFNVRGLSMQSTFKSTEPVEA